MGRHRFPLANRRRRLLILASALLAAPEIVCSQQQGKVWRIGIFEYGFGSAPYSVDRAKATRAGLRELGYVEGKNLVIEFRWADGKYERLPALAEELVRLKPDAIIIQGTPAALAAKQATKDIPIILS